MGRRLAASSPPSSALLPFCAPSRTAMPASCLPAPLPPRRGGDRLHGQWSSFPRSPRGAKGFANRLMGIATKLMAWLRRGARAVGRAMRRVGRAIVAGVRAVGRGLRTAGRWIANSRVGRAIRNSRFGRAVAHTYQRGMQKARQLREQFRQWRENRRKTWGKERRRPPRPRGHRHPPTPSGSAGARYQQGPAASNARRVAAVVPDPATGD